MTYDERERWLKQQAHLAYSEHQGFLDAQVFDSPKLWSSVDEKAQRRYELGFMDGKTILKCEGHATETFGLNEPYATEARRLLRKAGAS